MSNPSFQRTAYGGRRISTFAASTLNRILNEASGISPEMALRLSKALGRSPESWLTMQDNYDLWQAKKNVDLKKIRKIEFKYA